MAAGRQRFIVCNSSLIHCFMRNACKSAVNVLASGQRFRQSWPHKTPNTFLPQPSQIDMLEDTQGELHLNIVAPLEGFIALVLFRFTRG